MPSCGVGHYVHSSLEGWAAEGRVYSLDMTQRTEAEDPLADQIAALQPRLLRFAISLTRDREEAADVAQEAIARALASAYRFTPGTNLKAWLFRILRNVHLNRRRDLASRGAVSIEELPVELVRMNDDSRPVEREVLLQAHLKAVMDAFRSLPPLFALPLYLTSVEELTYAETARILDVPIGTVMSRVYRGRRLLAGRLADRR